MHVIRVGQKVDFQPSTEEERLQLQLPLDYLLKRSKDADELKPAQ